MTTQGPAWLPSADRTIPLFRYAAAAPIGRQPTALPRAWPDMAAGDVLDFTVDCSGWAADTGDPVASAAATVVPADIAVLAVRVVGALAVVWLAASAVTGPHTVTVTITTVSGQVVNAPVALLVDPGLPAAILAPGQFAAESGVVLTAENGAPLFIDTAALPPSVTLPDGSTTAPQPGISFP